MSDFDEVKRRLKALKVEVDSELTHPYRKRMYFRDFDQNRYEFIEYLTEDNRKNISYGNDP